MDSWGEARRLFYMGGAESKEGFHVAGNNLFNLMRGYPSGYFVGTGGYLFNIEYRLALFKIENVFWMFRSIERLYLSLFADLGHVWTGKWELDPSCSLGMELNVVAFLGDLKLNVSAGIAVGQRPYHSPMVYLRIGNSF
jgi:outer membrane protein assembly factor BamA